MAVLRSLIASASLALAIGCSPEGKRVATEDTVVSAPAATPARVEQTPATPAKPEASDSAGLVVTARGLGPLRAGMSVAAASAALHGALVAPTGTDTTGCRYVRWRGGPTGVKVMVEGGRIARVEVDSVGVRTSEGARVGDAEDRLQRLYHGRLAVSPQKYGPGHYLTSVDPADTSFALVFETSAGKVTRYRAGKRPMVDYVEGCG